MAASNHPPKWVFLYACSSAQTPSLSDAFLDRGVTSFMGWTDKTPAYTGTVDEVCRQILIEAKARNESLSQTLQRLTDSGMLPLEVLGSPVTLLLTGTRDHNWWEL